MMGNGWYLSLKKTLILRLSLAAQLGHFGYEVKQFSTARDLLHTLNEVIPAAIVIDLMLPEGKFAGAEAIQDLHRVHGSNVPIIFISVRSDVLARLQAVRAGATHYFVKPLSDHKLVKILNEVTKKTSNEPYRVLIVDDDTHLTAMYSFILEQAGLITRIVNESMRVLAEVESFRPELILMDVYMPESTGTEMAAVIRQHSEYTGIPIVYLSIENNF